MRNLPKILAAFIFPYICSCGGGNQEKNDFKFLEDSKKDALILPADAQMVDFERITKPLILSPFDSNDVLGDMSETYLDYGLISIGMADYKDIVYQNQYVVEVYKFPDNRCAFGLYAALRPRQCRIVPIGAQGFVDSTRICFVKGIYVVNIVGFMNAPNYEENIRKLAELTSANIGGNANLPTELLFFPAHGMVLNSERYYIRGFPGLEISAPTFSAEYVIGPEQVTVIYISAIGQKTFEDYLNHMKRNGRILEKEEDLDIGCRRLIDPDLDQLFVCFKEDRLFGIIGEFDPSRNRDFIDMLMVNFK